jgi:hypothetical protein
MDRPRFAAAVIRIGITRRHMTTQESIAKMVKLALRRHTVGMPKPIICFDENGIEVPWSAVFAVTPHVKQGQLEAAEPEPGTGYFCHIRLGEMVITGDQETYGFENCGAWLESNG